MDNDVELDLSKSRLDESKARLNESKSKIDNFCYRLVVSSLSGSIVICLIGGLTLSILNKPIPELLIVIGSNAIGAISGLLAPSPKDR
jgi:hypothetical protein